MHSTSETVSYQYFVITLHLTWTLTSPYDGVLNVSIYIGRKAVCLSLSFKLSIFDFQVGSGHGLPGIFALLEVKLWFIGFALDP